MPIHEERQYLDLVRRVIETGTKRIDRTGVGTRPIFGAAMRFDVSNGTIPILTTKKVKWDLAMREMLWFLSGETNIKTLVAHGVHIWTDWPLKKYREATGEDVDRDEFEARILGDDTFASQWGDLGNVYGKQWRAWETKDGRTIDQVARCIETLKTDRYSRRILFHGWNVGDLEEMALPPCHLLYQFGIEDDKICLILYCRSQDLGLGTPFNILAATMLLQMVSQQTGIPAGHIQWFAGDCHVYENQVDGMRIQLEREPRPFPKLEILRKPDSIDDYRIEDFSVVGYDPHPFIKLPVAV